MTDQNMTASTDGSRALATALDAVSDMENGIIGLIPESLDCRDLSFEIAVSDLSENDIRHSFHENN